MLIPAFTTRRTISVAVPSAKNIKGMISQKPEIPNNGCAESSHRNKITRLARVKPLINRSFSKIRVPGQLLSRDRYQNS
jgi:hypothetical protein